MKVVLPSHRGAALAVTMLPCLLAGETPAPTGLKAVRLDGEQIRVTVDPPPPGIVRIDWRSRSVSGTWGTGRPVEPISREFVLDGFRRYRPYSFELKFRGKDGWSKGTIIEIPPAPFVLGLRIDMEDLVRRGWAVKRERELPVPLLIVVEKDFDGDEMVVHHVLLYRRDGTALTDAEGKVLGFRVEVKGVRGEREIRLPLDALVEEALKRLGDPAARPDPAGLVLFWIPPPEDQPWLRREHLVSGVTHGFFFAEPKMALGIELRF